MANPRLFIIHGWEGNPRIHWLGWLADTAQKHGFAVTAPALPSPDFPDCEAWTKTISKYVGQPTADDFFVGHSLGPIAILRFLETLSPSAKIGGAVFVAGFASSLGISATESFFKGPLNPAVIKTKISKGIVDLYSDNDPYVPVEKAEEIQKLYGAKLVMMPNAGHINTDAGYTQLPLALEHLKKMAGR